jgi:hypothetical protein
MENFGRTATLERRELDQKKQITTVVANATRSQSSHPQKDGVPLRPLVRRRHAAGIPLNDPNSVF